jgi:hypothetical protein
VGPASYNTSNFNTIAERILSSKRVKVWNEKISKAVNYRELHK